jgi:acetyl-CoA C-acetyltransferase
VTATDNTPILVGIGVVQQREEDPTKGHSALTLMVKACERAASDAGSETLLKQADSIAVPKGIWPYTDPAGQIATQIGAEKAQSIFADIGILQQTIMNNACLAIQNGEQEIAIVAGGEAKFRDLCAQKNGITLESDADTSLTSDLVLTPDAEMMSDIEMARGLMMPVEFYALMENAMRYRDGQSIEEHRRELGELYSRFSHIAADNPDAWAQQAFSAEQIGEALPENRMLAFPYTKRMNTQWNVDQSCALIFCSVAKARALGIPEEKWVYPLSSSESEHMTLLTEREAMDRSFGAKFAGEKALQLAQLNADEIDLLELYSCFPAAVKIYARELGISLERALVVTGCMAFAGGPLNNFVLQATAKLAQQLRAGAGQTGMICCVSGLLTKQAFAIWGREASTDGFQYEDVSAEASDAVALKPLQDNYQGPATVVSYTVKPGHGIIAVCDTPDGARAIAISQDEALQARVQQEEFCGAKVEITADNQLKA